MLKLIILRTLSKIVPWIYAFCLFVSIFSIMLFCGYVIGVFSFDSFDISRWPAKGRKDIFGATGVVGLCLGFFASFLYVLDKLDSI